MSQPPSKIDGAEVIEWAWSGDVPFGVVYSSDGGVASGIFGLAICRYESSAVIYRFSCSKTWNTIQDSDYSSIKEAKDQLPKQYQNVSVSVKWKQK